MDIEDAAGNSIVWQDFFSNIVDILDFASNNVTPIADGQPANKELTITRIEVTCSVLRQLLPLSQNDTQEFIANLISNLEGINSSFIRDISSYSQWFPPSTIAQLSLGVHTFRDFTMASGPGRPKIYIPPLCLLHLRESGFSWNQISKMFLVSKWTILRRVNEYDLGEVRRFSEISDDELNRLVLSFFQEHGNFVGFSLIYGHLESLGIHIQHRRLKKKHKGCGSL